MANNMFKLKIDPILVVFTHFKSWMFKLKTDQNLEVFGFVSSLSL